METSPKLASAKAAICELLGIKHGAFATFLKWIEGKILQFKCPAGGRRLDGKYGEEIYQDGGTKDPSSGAINIP